ncbi:MAG: DUF2892 domain-containing protein [Bacteroidota bacterium]
MYNNLGSSDRLIRFVLMDFLLGFSLSGIDLYPWLANTCFMLFMLSMYLLLTMLAAYSPLYYLFGWDSKSAESVTPSAPSPQ